MGKGMKIKPVRLHKPRPTGALVHEGVIIGIGRDRGRLDQFAEKFLAAHLA